MSVSASERDVYSVSRLNREARALLEHAFDRLWVEGEISNLARPSSGHLYFSLKDSRAQISCALFKNQSLKLGFKPVEGMQVVVRARVSLYEPRGNFQMIVEHMEETGDGALRREFELLKQRLNQEGLFDPAHKKSVPALPRRIGVITSPSGAAIRDVLTVLKRRFPATPVIIYPTLVQGKAAAEQIAKTIQNADTRAECDVLLLTRGGGSLEDLWSFNEEVVARAVFDCQLPIVSAIGHEIDFVITDFVADQRAATPSAAAELLSPDTQEWLTNLKNIRNRLHSAVQQRLERRQEQLGWLSRQLQQQHPGQHLLQQNQRLDELEQRLHITLKHQLQQLGSHLRELTAQLLQHTPRHLLDRLGQHHKQLSNRLHQVIRVQLEHWQQHFNALLRALETVSPLATLQRGYSITLRQSDRAVVQNASQVADGDILETRLSQGQILSTVIQKKSK